MKNSNDETFNATIGNTVLCDGFLISMTDFVIEIDENKPKFKNFSSFSEINQYEINGYNKIRNYATFLKQPLKLEMFVPCDKDGNVLEYKPNEDLHKDAGSFMAYNKAKEKVLFEGFEEMKNAAVRDCVWIKDTETKFHIDTRYGTTVEHLIKSNLKLTQTALNAIFG